MPKTLPHLAGWLLGAVLALEGRALAQTATPRVEAVYPHDATAFTQGLELFEGKLFESTGLVGRSKLRRVAVTTGVVEKNHDLDSMLFAEGLTRIDRQLIQLTYTTGIAIVYDLDTFAELKRFTYTGEGWGLCYDGTDLVMTNGSDRLFFRDPATFAVRREVVVRNNGTAVSELNELECVGSLVYMNVWRTDNILRVDKATGNVLTLINAAGLLTAAERQMADVLNGIAYDEAKRRFYLTGKHWPKLFEVSFDFNPGGAGDAGVDGGIVDAGPADTGATVDVSPPRDTASDQTTVDLAPPRDTASRDGADANARDTTSVDVGPIDAGVPPADVSRPEDSGSRDSDGGQGGAGGAGGVGGTGGTGDAGAAGDAGSDVPQEGCACRTGAAGTQSSAPALVLLIGVALSRRARRAAGRA
jgi:glutaminyl-peptide cyclotransferase